MRQALRYRDKTTKEPVEELDTAFSTFIAWEHRAFLRGASLLFALANAVFLATDYQRFEASVFPVVVALRCAIMAVASAIVFWTFRPSYDERSIRVVAPLFAIGVAVVAYTAESSDTSYGILAVFIVYVFSFTPVPALWSVALCAPLVIGYGIVIRMLGDVVSGEGQFDRVGTLSLFLAMNAVVGYMLERSLKQTVLSEYVLYTDGNVLASQHVVAQLRAAKEIRSAVSTQRPQRLGAPNDHPEEEARSGIPRR